MAKLWKVVATRNNGKVVKGMSVEILDKNGNKPGQALIGAALQSKYDPQISPSHCGSGIFDFTEIK